MWPNHLGTKPYENGLGDQVVRVDWAPGSVFCPPTNWFHQHFNTGAGAGADVGVYAAGSQKFPMGIRVAAIRASALRHRVKQRGKLIEYEDEDPAIRRHVRSRVGEAGHRAGHELTMRSATDD